MKKRKFDFMKLWDEDTGEGYFCANKAKYTAAETEKLFQREYRAEMDSLEINSGSAEEYREQTMARSGYARFGVGPDNEGEPCGGYVFVKKKKKDLYGKPKNRGEFEVWAVKDGTEYDG
jgi:hypothetical protein